MTTQIGRERKEEQTRKIKHHQTLQESDKKRAPRRENTVHIICIHRTSKKYIDMNKRHIRKTKHLKTIVALYICMK